MNENGVKEVCGVIAAEMREGDMVNVTLTVRGGDHRVYLTHAPSWVVEPVVEAGYYASVDFGNIKITSEEEG